MQCFDSCLHFYRQTLYNLSERSYKRIKFHFYANDSQVYVYISHKNASAAFEQLNRCLNDVKDCM